MDETDTRKKWKKKKTNQPNEQFYSFLGSEFVCLSIDQYACDKYV